MKIVYKKNEQPLIECKQRKKLPMDKDPVFIAQLMNEIIEAHNRKIDAKEKKQQELCNGKDF